MLSEREELIIKAAAIDMGTNSSRLLIVDYNNGDYSVKERELITTRLGAGVDKNRILNSEAIKRGVKAVKKFKRTIEKAGAKEVAIVGTSALRDVKNSAELDGLLAAETGYEMKIVSGTEEARLTYRGVSLDNKADNLFIIDIGGGSTEFIWQNSTINFASLDIGAVRMTERFVDDPRHFLKDKEYNQIYIETKKEIDSIDFNIEQIEAVGVGGTITTLAAINQKMDIYNREKIHGHKLTLTVVRNILSDLRCKNLDEKKKISGLQPARADIITAGIIILEVLMKKLKIKTIRISENDILYGIIRQICE